MRGIYKLHPWNGLRWHDIHTNFYDDRFSQSSNIKVSISTNLEATVLVLLFDGIYEIRRWDGYVCHDVRTEFHEEWYRSSSIIKVLRQKFERL
jgi:hypothetical protein